MTNDCTTCAEYLVRRHELAVARHFMSDLDLALIASEDAGLSGSIQALLRVIFGYKPDIKTVHTIGQLLDGLADASPDLVIISDGIMAGNGRDMMSLISNGGFEGAVIVVSRTRRPSDIIGLKKMGAVDVIHPDRLDSARLCEAYIRACTFAALAERGHGGDSVGVDGDGSQTPAARGAVVVPLAPRAPGLLPVANELATKRTIGN